MRQGRTAGKTFIPKQYIDYYNSPYTKSQLVAKALAVGEGATIDELVKLTSVSRSRVKALLSDMRHYKFIYISGWRKTTGKGRAPVYSVGNLPDEPRDNIKKRKSAEYAAIKHQVSEQQKRMQQISDRCVELAKRLVPKRTDEQQREVNRQYLNWISGGVYG